MFITFDYIYVINSWMILLICRTLALPHNYRYVTIEYHNRKHTPSINIVVSIYILALNYPYTSENSCNNTNDTVDTISLCKQPLRVIIILFKCDAFVELRK